MQFYPGDWRKDLGVQTLTFQDRGVWIEMLMLMHESERRGVMVLNEQPMSDEMIAQAIGLDIQTFKLSLGTLLKRGVASREPGTDAVMSRRMVRDEFLRKIRAEAGCLGGNPALLKKNPTNLDKQNGTPSSSFSSSCSYSDSKHKQDTSAEQCSALASVPSKFSLFKSDYEKAFLLKNAVQAPWDLKEASQLSRWIKANPSITRDQWQTILKNKGESPVTHTTSLSKWIGNALSWLKEPGADDWGKQPKVGCNSNMQQKRDAFLARRKTNE
jgi:hypothetical protein